MLKLLLVWKNRTSSNPRRRGHTVDVVKLASVVASTITTTEGAGRGNRYSNTNTDLAKNVEEDMSVRGTSTTVVLTK